MRFIYRWSKNRKIFSHGKNKVWINSASREGRAEILKEIGLGGRISCAQILHDRSLSGWLFASPLMDFPQSLKALFLLLLLLMSHQNLLLSTSSLFLFILFEVDTWSKILCSYHPSMYKLITADPSLWVHPPHSASVLYRSCFPAFCSLSQEFGQGKKKITG